VKIRLNANFALAAPFIPIDRDPQTIDRFIVIHLVQRSDTEVAESGVSQAH